MKYNSVMDKIYIEPTALQLSANPEAEVLQAENAFHRKIADVCDIVIEKQAFILLLTGPSASGKTTSAKKIASELQARGKKVNRISLDNFYKNEDQLPYWSDGYQNYESVEGLDIPCFDQVISTLLTTGHTKLPVFDFKSGTRTTKTIDLAFDSETFLIFEGIHTLNPLVSNRIQNHAACIKIYISTHSDFVDTHGNVLVTARDLRLMRRLIRDLYHRDASVDETFQMWNYVLKGEDLYIRPFRAHADLHINSTHLYEPFLYHDELIRALEKIPSSSSYYEISSHLLACTRHFFQINPTLIPRNSLIQEFIRPV